jgi:hypothetical protein
VAELSLDYDQRHPFTGHLDSMRVAQLVWRDPSSDTSSRSDSSQLSACARGSPRTTAAGAMHHAEQRADREGGPRLEPRRQLIPRPTVHPDLATAATLTATHKNRATITV